MLVVVTSTSGSFLERLRKKAMAMVGLVGLMMLCPLKLVGEGIVL